MLTDVAAVDREFDYEVPAAWQDDGRAARLEVGTMVRVGLQGRPVGGWVTGLDPAPEPPTPSQPPARRAPAGPAPDPELEAGPSPQAATPAELRLNFNGPESDRAEVDSGSGVERRLRPLRKLVGVGPSPEVLELARWAAWRWAGRTATFYRTASPPRVVPSLPEPARPRSSPERVEEAEAGWVEAAFERGVSVVRIPPAGDRGPLLAAALRRGDVLVVTPHVGDAVRLAGWLRRRGAPAALLPEDWAQAAAGGVVVGTRAAVFGPAPRLAAIVVLDEHDEALAAEDSPTWHAREVAVERARRAGVPCVLVSPTPTLEAQQLADDEPLAPPRAAEHDAPSGGSGMGGRPELLLPPRAAERDAPSGGSGMGGRPELLLPPRAAERDGWPHLEIVDQRDPEVSRHGLLTAALAARLRDCRRAVCVLNRKGRSRLAACAGCGELVVCDACGAVAAEDDTPADPKRPELVCRRCGERRPRVCSGCGATRLRVLRPGITKLRADLVALMGEPVAEISGSSKGPADARVVIGTEAALYRVPEADLVAFLDFDQELTAPRYRANEQALGLLARAARLAGRRSAGGRVLVQTRLVDHPVIRAARRADPGLLSAHDRNQRERLGLPPFGALAEIARSGAPAFVERLGNPTGLEVTEAGENRWVVRSPDADTLVRALAAVERPPGHLRLAVDPLRL